jgi:hypothetical protein
VNNGLKISLFFEGCTMKNFKLVLCKSYIVNIKAEDEERARFFCECFTGDSKDISINKEREEYNFKIEDMRCTVNETFDVAEVVENERD